MKEITPAHLRCAIGSCPGVYEIDGGDLVIVGKKLSAELKQKIEERVGEDEYAIVIKRDFFENLNKS